MTLITSITKPSRLLIKIEQLGHRIASVALAPLDAAQIDASLAVLRQHYGPNMASEHLVPPVRPDELRSDLATRAPQLVDLAGELSEALEGSLSAIVIPRIGLSHLSLQERAGVLFALSVALGEPTATDKVDRRVVWDVKVRKEKVADNSVSTFSEHPYEADLHTDTQYFPEPERYMLLYVVAPARCGGGVSRIRSLECLRNELSATEDGRWAIDYLTGRNLPFRIPAVFTHDGKGDGTEVTFASIFDQRPEVRYRIDTLNRGLQLYPELDTPELRKAIGLVDQAMNNPDRLLQLAMASDSLQLLNNHTALHGRSPFSDYERHVLRIRIAERGAISK